MERNWKFHLDQGCCNFEKNVCCWETHFIWNITTTHHLRSVLLLVTLESFCLSEVGVKLMFFHLRSWLMTVPPLRLVYWQSAEFVQERQIPTLVSFFSTHVDFIFFQPRTVLQKEGGCVFQSFQVVPKALFWTSAFSLAVQEEEVGARTNNLETGSACMFYWDGERQCEEGSPAAIAGTSPQPR